ncbi:MAG TPA: STAS/SEC14 domain-containing protein [Acidimicrobiia bacterium]|jgi:hypothetical protein
MLQRIEAADTVVAFRAVGKVERSDYERFLEPAVEALLADKGEVRFVYVLGDDFDGYSVGAGWEDTKLGLHHLSKWKRVAVVTDHDWVRHAVGMFRWMIPGDVKVFPLADQAEALGWAAA